LAIDRTSDRPVYKQVADALRAAVLSGELPEGGPIPSETELMERYGVSRNSARSAVALLRIEGVVLTEHGRGSFVRPQRPLRRLSSSRYSGSKRKGGKRPLQAEAQEQGLKAEQDFLGSEVVQPPVEVSDRLGLGPSDQTLVRRHLLSIDGKPVQIADSYFPLSIAQGTAIERAEKIERGVHAELELVLGYKLDHFTEELTFRMPTPDEARRLALSPGIPVVRLLRTLYDDSDQPLEVSDFLLAGDSHVLVYEVPAG
jgi:GntR family transcriptional regulator